MKLEVNITKRKFFALFGAVLLLAGAIVVYAAADDTSVFLTPDQIDWTQPIPGDSNINGDLTTTGNVLVSGNITAYGLDVSNKTVSQSGCICVGSGSAAGCVPGGHSATVIQDCGSGWLAVGANCEITGSRTRSTSDGRSDSESTWSCTFSRSGSSPGSTCHSRAFTATTHCLKIE